MITILHDIFVGLCYLLGIGAVGFVVVLAFLMLDGAVKALRKKKEQ